MKELGLTSGVDRILMKKNGWHGGGGCCDEATLNISARMHKMTQSENKKHLKSPDWFFEKASTITIGITSVRFIAMSEGHRDHHEICFELFLFQLNYFI